MTILNDEILLFSNVNHRYGHTYVYTLDEYARIKEYEDGVVTRFFDATDIEGFILTIDYIYLSSPKNDCTIMYDTLRVNEVGGRE